MNTLITGADGVLGQELSKYFPNAACLSHHDLDVRDAQAVLAKFEGSTPELVIHLAAIANVRLCEQDKKLAKDTNVAGTENIVNACKSSAKRPLLYFPSSPCVFRGDTGNYSENSKPDPCNFYGRTKMEAERIVLSYDNSLVFRKNYVARKKWKYPRAFVDRFGTYLFADELASIISQLPNSGLRGIVHIAGKERLSMFDLARVTTPDVSPMKMSEVDLRLTADMSLVSERINELAITKSPNPPTDYRNFRLTLKVQAQA